MKNGFISGKDASPRYYRGWEAGKDPLGTVVIVHGYAEHGDRYSELAGVLNQIGFDVWAEDHYGHGQSGGKRAEVPRFELFVEDLSLFLEEKVIPSGKGRPLFLYGHSMGGAIALLTASARQHELKGLILSAPLVRPNSSSTVFEQKAARFLGKILPSLQFKIFPPELLSHDPAVIQAYRDDPLVYSGKMKVGMGAEILRAGELLSDQLLRGLTLPLLLLHGRDDQVVPLSNSSAVHSLASSRDKTMRIFDGMYHEIHNEADKAEVFKVVTNWLNAHTDDSPKEHGNGKQG